MRVLEVEQAVKIIWQTTCIVVPIDSKTKWQKISNGLEKKPFQLPFR